MDDIAVKYSTMAVSENVKADIVEGMDLADALKYLSEEKNGRRNIDDSFYVCDLGDVALKCKVWNDLFPRIRPFYAVKTAAYKPMLRCLSVLGTGFNCAGQCEIDTALKCGALPSDIVYSHPNKQKSHIIHAKQHGINLTDFDSESELCKVKKYYPEAEVLLRIAVQRWCSVPTRSFERFGATLEKAKKLLIKAKEMDLKVAGISFHVGTSCTKPSVYASALKDASILFEFGKELGMDFTVLNIGGGFHGSEGAPCKNREIADVVNSSLDDLFSVREYEGLRIISEPGRYFATSAFTLATNVIHKSESDRGVDVEYAANDSAYGSFSPLGRHAPGDLDPFILKAAERTKITSRVWGGTPGSLDVLIEKKILPEMNEGEWLFWKNAGAYTFALYTGVNGVGPQRFYNIISNGHAEIFNLLCRMKLSIGRPHSPEVTGQEE